MRHGGYGSQNIYRSDDGILLGVCEGIAKHWDFRPWGVRLLFILLQCSFVPFMFVVYIVLAFIMKPAPSYRYY